MNRLLLQNKHGNKTGGINHVIWLLKVIKHLDFNKRNNITIIHAVYPEYHWVMLFTVFAFRMVKVSSIRCMRTIL